MKPFSEACERNREPILEVLRAAFAETWQVLEVGSGTGQHAVYFGAHMPWLHWQPSDRRENLPGIRLWLAEAGLANVAEPIELDVEAEWPTQRVDGVFSANTVHIMSWPAVAAFFRGVAQVLEPGGLFVLYGPFRYGGAHTSESNDAFDTWLRGRDPASGVRDFEALETLAQTNGLGLLTDHSMPANNRLLIWRRLSASEPDTATR